MVEKRRKLILWSGFSFMNFTVKSSEIEGILLLSATIREDERGIFVKIFEKSELGKIIPFDFPEIYISTSNKGVIRGLHFQTPPMEQGKLIVPVKGSIYDVALDIRSESPSFGRIMGVTLSSSSGDMIFIPPGFAHGFQALENQTTILNAMTNEYSPSHEGGIHALDNELSIHWPIAAYILSNKDKNQVKYSTFLERQDDKFLR